MEEGGFANEWRKQKLEIENKPFRAARRKGELGGLSLHLAFTLCTLCDKIIWAQ